MNKKYIWAGITVILLIILIVIVGKQQNKVSNQSANALKIGVVFSQTGAAGGWGERHLHAAQMAVDEINKSGGVDGKPIELIVEDGKTDPKASVTGFQKLVSIDKPYVVIGDMWDFVTEPMVALSSSTKNVLMAASGLNVPFKTQSDYYYFMGHRKESLETAINTFFDSNPEIKTTYVFCFKNGWGEANEKVFNKVAEERGIEVIGRDCAYFGDTYKTQAAKLISANPDSVFMITNGPNSLKALKELGYKGKILATSDLIEVVYNKQVASSYTEGIYIIEWPGSENFTQKYKTLYNQYPINEAQNAYNLIKVIAEAYKNNSQDIRKGLKNVILKTDKGVIDFKNNDKMNANHEPSELFKVGANFNLQPVK